MVTEPIMPPTVEFFNEVGATVTGTAVVFPTAATTVNFGIYDDFGGIAPFLEFGMIKCLSKGECPHRCGECANSRGTDVVLC